MQYPRRSESLRAFTRRPFLIRVMLICFGVSLARGQVLLAELPVPKISDVTRVDSNTQPSQLDLITATYIFKTSPHATLGDAYVIVTDQTDEAYLDPLKRLAKFHQGSIVHVDDFGTLRTSDAERDKLISDLRRTKPRFVAIGGLKRGRS